MKSVFITSYTSASSLGIGNSQTLDTLKKGKNTIYKPDKSEKFSKPFFPLQVNLDIKKDITLSAKIALKLLSLIENDWINLSPIPLFMATSTGGIKETEEIYKNLIFTDKKAKLSEHHYFYDIFPTIKEKYKDKIPECYTFATACSSSGHSIMQAYRFIKNGIIDKAIVLGVDALSITTMYGFDALKLVSENGTRPLSKTRDGLTLGEGGGILLLESNPKKDPIAKIIGASSNSDGYHITAPNPAGTQQKECVLDTLKQSGIKHSQIDYINAHGTGTPANDEIEINVLKSIFTNPIPITSLKGFIGHTVGSSAIAEIGITLEMLKNNIIFQQPGLNDPLDEAYIPKKNIEKKVKYFLKNSFGFGGNNTSIIIENLF